jgi:hypothetical protein
MKNGVSKKLLGEEKPALKIDRIFSLSFFISLTFVSILTAQIPVNGFCGFREYVTRPNHTKVFTVDFTNDGWRDLIIIDRLEKKYSVQSWEKDKFTTPGGRITSTSFYDFRSMNVVDPRSKMYGYISRKDREAGIVSFNNSGTANIQSKVKFDSYPSGIDVSDVNRNGKSELLVSGNNFQGLSLIIEEKKKLVETPIDSENLYSYSNFIDLDYDSYPDIAAVDLLKNSIIFFNNDRTGKFNKTRSIDVGEVIKEFSIADINSNGYNDLVFVNENGFEVLLGDSVSSFKNKLTIKTDGRPDKYTILDFNGDGYNDIAFINYFSGKLFVLFAKGANEFYPPIVYFQRNGIVDIVSYIDRGGRKLAALDGNGKIYIVDRLTEIDDATIALAVSPSLVGTFNYLNDRRKEIFFIDDEQPRIVFLISAKRLFDTYYDYRLSQVHTNITVDETQRDRKTFYFYSEGERIIELLRINFQKMEFSKRILYASGPIYDLKITSDRLKDRQTIFVLPKEKGKLFIESFDFRDFRYLSSGTEEIADNVEKASLLFNVYKEIFHFESNSEKLFLKKSVFNRKVQSQDIIAEINIKENENPFMEVKSFEDEEINQNITAAWIQQKNNTELFLVNRNKTNKIILKDFCPDYGTLHYLDGEKENSIFMYDRSKGKIKKVVINNSKRGIDIEDVFESKNINSYIVDKLNSKKEYLIYSDKSDNLIKLKNLR